MVDLEVFVRAQLAAGLLVMATLVAGCGGEVAGAPTSAAETRLTAALCAVFPKINCDYPRDASGQVRPDALTRAEFDAYQGVLGHWHVQTNKTDPGPAFQWDPVINGARVLMGKK